MPTPTETRASARAAATTTTLQDIKAPIAIFVIVFISELPSWTDAFEFSNPLFAIFIGAVRPVRYGARKS